MSVLQAIAVIVFGIGGLAFSFAQLKQAAVHLQLELFDRRSEIYRAARDALAYVTPNGTFPVAQQVLFGERTQAAAFLTTPEISSYLRHIGEKLAELDMAQKELNSHLPDQTVRQQKEQEVAGLLEWVRQQYMQLDAKFMPILRLDEVSVRNLFNF